MLANWGVKVAYTGVIGGEEEGLKVKSLLDNNRLESKYIEINYEVKTDKIRLMQSVLNEKFMPNDCTQSNPKKWICDSKRLAWSKNTSINIEYKKWKPKKPFANLLIEISLLVKNGDIIISDASIGKKIKKGIEINLSISIANPHY